MEVWYDVKLSDTSKGHHGVVSYDIHELCVVGFLNLQVVIPQWNDQLIGKNKRLLLFEKILSNDVSQTVLLRLTCFSPIELKKNKYSTILTGSRTIRMHPHMTFQWS